MSAWETGKCEEINPPLLSCSKRLVIRLRLIETKFVRFGVALEVSFRRSETQI
jgi:hypothetical protein